VLRLARVGPGERTVVVIGKTHQLCEIGGIQVVVVLRAHKPQKPSRRGLRNVAINQDIRTVSCFREDVRKETLDDAVNLSLAGRSVTNVGVIATADLSQHGDVIALVIACRRKHHAGMNEVHDPGVD
jgi:hypothetical protein